MPLLDYLSRSTSQTVVAETPAPVAVSEAPELAPVVAVEEPKVETAAPVEPEVVAPVSESEAIKEEVEVSYHDLLVQS